MTEPANSFVDSQKAVEFADVLHAAEVIAAHAHRTPVVTCQTLDLLSGQRLFFKCENFQKVGAFKFRGAFHAIARLSEAQRECGVITHSSGNHGQALALAAARLGVQATVVMPSTAPQVKRDAVAGYGARVVLCEPTLEARESTVAELQRESGAHLVPPYNHPHVIAGQGTAALEFIDQVAGLGHQLDALVAPVGGGGLISGTCVVAEHQQPPVKVIASEPAGADDAYLSKQAGKLIPQTRPDTIADGLLTSLGDLTWPYIRDVVEAVITVSDSETIAAMKLMWSRAKLLVEASCATSLAAVLSDRFPMPPNSNIGIIISGGNVDLDRLPWLVSNKE